MRGGRVKVAQTKRQRGERTIPPFFNTYQSMKKTIKTQHDGWECEPKLQEAVRYINELAASVYEIEHCVRHSNIKELVEGMLLELHDATRILETIDTDVDYETSKEEDNDFDPAGGRGLHSHV